ncbi:hypothetical protein KI387_044699, partial [Taxus chinensis]
GTYDLATMKLHYQRSIFKPLKHTTKSTITDLICDREKYNSRVSGHSWPLTSAPNTPSSSTVKSSGKVFP